MHTTGATAPARSVYQQVGRLHAANIDQGFLSTLGGQFLALLYEAIDAEPGSVLLTVERDGRVVGFVSGSTGGMGAIYRQLLRRWPRLVPALVPALLSPRKVRRIAEIVLHGGRASPVPDLPEAELLSISVDPGYRSQGLAPELFQRLEAHFHQHGIDRFRIVVGEALVPAHRFYTRMGARPAGTVEVHRGQDSVVYVREIAPR